MEMEHFSKMLLFWEFGDISVTQSWSQNRIEISMPKKNQSNPKPKEPFTEGFMLNPLGNLLSFHQTQICLVLFLILMRESYWFKLFGIYWVESTCSKNYQILQQPMLENFELF